MGIKTLLSLILLSTFQLAFAQKEGYIWYFGSKAGITFNTNPPSALTNGQLSTSEGCATISTAGGRVLFYTDGIKVWDSTHNTMPNGTGLKGDPSSTQSGIIVPRPDSAHIFYIFTVAQLGGADGLQFSEVNMKLNSGKGDVVSSKKNIKLKTPVCEKITAVKNSNGKDYWVLCPKYNSDSFFVYSVTNAGVNKTPLAYRTGFVTSSSSSGLGYIKVSPDGKKVAYVNWSEDSCAVGDFDASTGKISNLWRFYLDEGYGLEFSAKTKYLYVQEFNKNKVVQYDLSAGTKAALISSRKVIDSGYSPQTGALQIGPNGKIYITHYGGSYLSVIHAPDSAKFACRPQKNFLSLGSKTGTYGLPTFIQSFFQKKTFNVTRNCITDSAKFNISDLGGLDSVKWDFDDPGSGSKNTSNLMTGAYHIYNKVGYYNVSLVSFHKPTKDTVKIKVYVKNPKPKLGKDSIACNTAMIMLQPQKEYLTYKWTGGSTASSIGATANGTYILNVKDTAGCLSADTIQLSFPKVKALFRLSDTLRCYTGNFFTMKDTSKYINDNWKKSTFYYGDGLSVNDTNGYKSYFPPATYTIKLVVQSKLGCKDSTIKKITVLPSTTIGFNINKTIQCFNTQNFNFTNTSTISSGTIAGYLWTFGDDSSSTKKDITGKVYLKDSTYKVKLKTTTDKGCKDSITKTVTLYPNAKVSFTVSKAVQCFRGNLTDFSSSYTIRTGIIGSYVWYFGDNTFGFTKLINNKKYSTADSFNVMLITYTDKGCQDTTKKLVVINPNAKVGFNINKPDQCLRVQDFAYTNTSTISKGSMTYAWNLGDDSTSIAKDITGKIYPKDTAYKVTLITTSDKSCSDTMVKTASVYPDPAAGFYPIKLTQCFNYNNSLFNGTSTIKYGTLSYKWNFGDSTYSTLKNVTVKHYNRPDTFKVSLLAISDKGCRDSMSKDIIVNPSPVSNFKINKDTQCYEWHKFNYTNTSTISNGSILFDDWLLGDGSTAPFKDITGKVYSSFGNYNVKLTSTSDKNCKDTVSKSVVVHASPVAGFTINKDRQCFRDNLFNYINTSTINSGSISKTKWDLGNSTVANTPDIFNLVYLTEDTFMVQLVSLSDKGCYDTSLQMVVTFAQPSAKFLVPKDTQCWNNNYFNINNLTTLKYGKLKNTWAFGDGTFDNNYKPLTKKYANKSASYVIRYTAESDQGCKDSTKHKVTLLERPASDFLINDSVQCFRGHLFSFTNNTSFSVMNTLSYFWDYGNGNKSTGFTPQTATYPNAQYYNVKLVSYSSLTNCYDTIIKKVLPAPHAVPSFSANLDSQCFRFNQFNFTNKSTLTFGKMTYEWTFNDNTKSTQKDPAKHYTSGSNYAVKLVVTTNQDCKDSITKPIVLIPHPKAAFTINDSVQCLNKHSFDFTNNTTLGYGTFASQWLMDDATQSNNKDISAKKYSVGDRHKVILTVNSNFNCTDTFIQTLFLEKPKSTVLSLVQNDSQCLKRNLFKLYTHTTDPKVYITNWNWSMGDGNTGIADTAKYHYTADGRYNIIVQTVSAIGCLDSASTWVQVHPQPKPAYEVDTPCFPEPLQFKDKSTINTGKITAYKWLFGDGSNSSDQDPLKYYLADGTYDIKLIAESDYGCIDTLLQQHGAKLRKKPEALFSYLKLPSKQPELINIRMHNQSSNDIISNNWQFDNGFSSNDDEPETEYTDTGKHFITLFVKNDVGCKDTFMLTTESLFPDFFFYLPNSFSPEVNNINDEFKATGSKYVSSYLMEIYNRWGEKVFESHDINKGWDGTYKGQPCQQDTYLCKIYLVPINGKKKFHEISITLLR